MNKKKINICVLGLGYIGLPLATEFSKYFNVIGFDLNNNRIEQLQNGIDINSQISKKKLLKNKLNFTFNPNDISKCNVYIITVPTPINKKKKPNLSAIKKAISLIAKYLKKNDCVVLESTVYPGLTDEVIIPMLEKKTNLKVNKEFYVGYSPERISPGDKLRTLKNIKKIVSGSNSKSTDFIYKLYKKIITAGLYKAPSIKIAEASKILENVQRDINISLMNEVSLIFNKMNIDTHEVIKAASTKWNFIKFTPGLVGGHCISVDPYYLKYKSEQLGYKPRIISTGRNVNEKMINIIFKKINSFLKNKLRNAKIGIMGITFKENCSDVRNSQILRVIKLLIDNGCKVQIIDPLVNVEEIPNNYKKLLVRKFLKKLDCLILATPHKEFLKLNVSFFEKNLKNNSMIFDVKKVLDFKFKKNISLFSF